MADSIHSAWISDYLIQMAEAYGGDLGAIPPREKPGRAQLVKFLTYLRPEDEGSCIWALLSDKAHIIHVRLTSEAIKQHKLNPTFHGKSLTQYKTALVLIKNFRPCFARVPLGGGDGRGMSPSEQLFLEIAHFQVKGSFDEDVWGSPKDMAANAKVSEWMEGLRSGGGGGLELQALQARQQVSEVFAEKQPVGQQTLPRRPAQIAGARKTVKRAPQAVPATRPAPASAEVRVDPKKVYEKSWRYVTSSSARRKRALPPADLLAVIHKVTLVSNGEVEAVRDPHTDAKAVTSMAESSTPPKPPRPRRNPLDISSSPPGSPKAQRPEPLPATPSHWSESSPGSPQPDLPDAETSDSEDEANQSTDHNGSPRARNLMASTEKTLVGDDDDAQSDLKKAKVPYAPLPNTLSSYLSAPTPAQRPMPLSSSPLPNPPSTPTASKDPQMSSAKTPDTRTPLQRPYTRRVPLPRAGRSVVSIGRILVPNSDTSGTASQPQSQEQGQLQSQSQLSQIIPEPSQPSQSQSQPSQTSQVIPGPSQIQHGSHRSPSRAPPSQNHGQSQSQNHESGQSARTHQSLSYTSQSSYEKGMSQGQMRTSRPTTRSQLRNEVEILPSSDAPIAPESVTETAHQATLAEALDRSPELKTGRAARRSSKGVFTAKEAHATEPGGRAALRSQATKPTDGNDSSVTEDEDADDEMDVDELDMSRSPRGTHPLAREEEESLPVEEEEESPSIHSLPVTEEDEADEVEGKSRPQRSRAHPVAQEDEESQTAPVQAVAEESQTHAQEGAASSNELDSGDAWTKVVVDSYSPERAENTASSEKKRSSRVRSPGSRDVSPKPAKARRPLKRQATHSSLHDEGSDAPLRPSSPDVFLSEASFHASQDIPPMKLTSRGSFSKSHPAQAPRASTSNSVVAQPTLSSAVKTPPSGKPHAPAETIYHYPEAWRAPAFQLLRTNGKGKEREQPIPKAALRQPAARSKRPIEVVSSPEHPPPKKQKLSVTSFAPANATSMSGPSVGDEKYHVFLKNQNLTSTTSTDESFHRDQRRDSSSKIQLVPSAESSSRQIERQNMPSEVQATAGSATNGTGRHTNGLSVKKLDLLRTASMSSSAPSTKRKRPNDVERSMKASTSKPEVRTIQQLSPGGSTSHEIKQVDFSSTESSRSLSRKRDKRAGSGAVQYASFKQDIRPLVQAAKDVSARQVAENSRASSSRAVGSTCVKMEQDDSQPDDSGEPASGGEVPATRSSSGLLGGYFVDFNMVRARDGPPLVTWRELSNILLRTGRTRTLAQRRMLGEHPRPKQG
ncbi:hypothetical protein BKA93DRAFT_928052 [Sparassis latifolia]